MSASYAQLALPESSPGTENDRNVNAHIANVLRLKLLHQIAAGDAAASSLPPYGHDLLAFIPRARVPHLDSQLLSDHVLRLLQSAKLPPVPQAAVLMLGLHVLVEVVGNRWVHSSLLGSLAGVGELADYHGGGSRAGGGDEDDPFRGWALEEIHEYLSDALLTSDAERSDPALSAKLYEAIARLDSVRLWKVLTHALKKAAAQRPAAAAATAGASTTPSSPSPPPSAAAASTSTATNAAWKQFQKYATLALLAADFDAVLAAEEREPALRDYQREAVEAIWNGGNNSTNYIIVSPTGTGKTRIFVETSR